MASELKRFTVSPADEGYLIAIETEDGETVEISASFEQLDLISEEIERILDTDEEDALSED